MTIAIRPPAQRSVAETSESPQTPRRHTVPLSFAQQPVWFVNALAPRTGAYNIRRAVRLRGPLDVAALEASLNDVVAGHAALRTTFTLIDGEPMQVIASRVRIRLVINDVSDRAPDQRETALRDGTYAEGSAPFDLAAGPLLRATLWRLEPDDHVLLIVIHHIVFDDGAIQPFNRDLESFYRLHRRSTGPRPDLAPPAFDYPEYTVRQRAIPQAEVARELAYWRAQLAGAPLMVGMPTDRPRPAVERFEGDLRLRRLAPELAARVRGYGDGCGATPFMTLCAAFNILLYRWTEHDDLVIGTPIANRTTTDVEQLIGLFVNLLPLRTKLHDEMTFDDVLAQVRDVALDAFDHQEYPFAGLVSELRPQRGSASPLNVMFFVRGDLGDPLRLDGLRVEKFELVSTTAKCDLSLRISNDGGGLLCCAQYDRNLFEAATIDRLLTCYERLLAAIVDAPATPIAKLPLLDDGERRRIVVEWNATEAPYVADRRVHEVIEAHAARTPEAIAVCGEGMALTYRQLNARANQISRALRARGARPQEPIGVCARSSPGAIASALAVLKAGAAYLPLDLDYPGNRITTMLADSGARLVLAEHDVQRDGVAAWASCVSVLDIDAPECTGQSDENVPTVGTPDDLAYIMYTSGSTGTPKGVLITHRAILRLTTSSPNYLELTASDVVGAVSNWSFDAATFELWGALTNGARIAIVSRDTVLTPHLFASTLRREGISVMFLTAALLTHIARHAPGAFATLRCLLVGGESPDPASLRAIFAAGPPGRVLNAYGPTESTTFAVTHEISQPPAGPVPLGRPIANTAAFVLDRHLNVVPPHFRGQLYLGGPGLARGYLGDDDPAAHKFVPSPFRADEKLYATGDLARYRDDGVLDFLGRIDRQVKVRGFRIELGEVEAALERLPGVEAAAARIIGTGPEKRLIAYVAAPAMPERDTECYRRSLAAFLPRHVLPDSVIALDELPLGPNGKVDTSGLPVSALRSIEAGEVRLGDPTKLALLEMWKRLLPGAAIGVRDDFFSVGGHSLLAARLIAEVRETFDVRVELAAFFEDPTVTGLARLVREGGGTSGPLTPLRSTGSKAPLFFLHGDWTGGGHYARRLARALPADQPFFALHPHGHDGSPLPETIEEMAQEYAGLIRAATPGPYALGGFCSGGLVAYEIAGLLRDAGETVTHVILMDTTLLRGRFVRTAISLDGWAARLGLSDTMRRRLRVTMGNAAAGIARVLTRVRLVCSLFDPRQTAIAWSRVHAGLRRHVVSDQDAVTVSREHTRWMEVAARYIPRRREASVALLLSADEGAREKPPLARGWRGAADEVRVVTIPGEHLAAITRYVDDAASALVGVLDGGHQSEVPAKVPKTSLRIRRAGRTGA